MQKACKKWLLPTVALIAVLALLTPLAQAEEPCFIPIPPGGGDDPPGATYSDYDRYDLEFLVIKNTWELYIKIDTTAHTFYIKWSTNAAPYSLLGTYFALDSYVRMHDDKGWICGYGPWFYPPIAANGEWTVPYPNSYTWAYGEFRWTYFVDGYLYPTVTLHCAVYVGA